MPAGQTKNVVHIYKSKRNFPIVLDHFMLTEYIHFCCVRLNLLLFFYSLTLWRWESACESGFSFRFVRWWRTIHNFHLSETLRQGTKLILFQCMHWHQTTAAKRGKSGVNNNISVEIIFLSLYLPLLLIRLGRGTIKFLCLPETTERAHHKIFRISCGFTVAIFFLLKFKYAQATKRLSVRQRRAISAPSSSTTFVSLYLLLLFQDSSCYLD